MFTHKTIEILGKQLFSLYKHNVFTILIAPEFRRFAPVLDGSNNFMKKGETPVSFYLKIIKHLLLFVAFSALGRSSRRLERRP